MPELQSLVGQKFAFASGRTGVLQQLLLTSSDRDRLLGAKDLSDAEQILTELKFTSVIDQGLRKSDDILNALSHWVRNEVEQMSPESSRPTFSVLWLEEDAPLLSYELKAFHGLTSATSKEPTTGMTAYDPEELKALVQQNATGRLPSHLANFVREMKKAADWKPEEIDAKVAQYIADLQQKLARTSGSTLVQKYVEHKIDLTNIRTALRLKEEQADLSVFLSGGTLNLKKIAGNAEAIAKAVEQSALPNNIADAIRSATDLELALAKVTADDIAHMWNVPLSIEPLFAFAALGSSQIKLIRALTIGKRASLSPQEIKDMLPPFLSASHYVLS